MAFIPVPNTAQVNINQTLHAQQVRNTLYFERPAPWSVQSLTALVQDIVNPFIELVDLQLSNNLKYVSVEAFDLTTQSGAYYVDTSMSSNEGEVDGAALPGNAAVVVTFKTAQRGKSFRGRNYVAGIPESNASGNVITAPMQNSLITAYSSMLGALDVDGFDVFWVVVSRYTGGGPGVPSAPRAAGISTTVTAVQCNADIDSQRRRLNGRGA